ncbi:hypothetical protein [Streptomyces boncukensis]|uniref:Integral membrane protein n=1 Tax=Streptomyces boncukensis TaxID=2711219 RepID=A0A6G4WX10_9ACTN|nr:hypothetical protein [Streptomyces boncukensis]NGO68991.1 hypothetical protein [Streptomyces boncukensis]
MTRIRTGTALALLALGYALQLLGVLLAGAVPAALGAALGALTDTALLAPSQRPVARWLGRTQLTAPVRQLLRDGLFLGALVRLDTLRPDAAGAWLLGAVLGCWALHFLCQAVAAAVRTRRRLPFVIQNIDGSGLGLTPAPPRLFARQGTQRLAAAGLLTTAGMTVSAATESAQGAALAASLCCAVLLAGTARLSAWLLPGRRVVDEERALDWLDGWLADYRPTIGLYFSGGTSSAYQVNMWLTTLAALDGRPLVVLRERFMVRRLDTTDVPVVCLPRVAHLMRLEHSTLRVLLHPSNSGKTSQVLRIPSIKHAFINHGESDKLSSCNPYARAYDQVWVAGAAARERYRLADIGVEDKDVVEVGRPQLAGIRPAPGTPREDGRLTVLYAPTWEGWTTDPGNTSLVLAGEEIVRALLADDRVRLLYKPHPMTGTVDPRAGDADRRLQTLIAQANARRAGPGPAPEAVRALERATAQLDRLTAQAVRASADEVERMRVQSRPEPGRADRVAAATERWEAAYWAALPPYAHQVVTGSRPGVHSCFNQADLLISDVSSVVSDFLVSEKPYAVANTSGMSEEAYRAAFPTVRAATLLTPGAADVPALLATVRHPERDHFAAARRELKTHLLGPAEPPSRARFNRAALALAAEAEARNARQRDLVGDGPAERVVWTDIVGEAESEGAPDTPQALAEAFGDVGDDERPEGP